ncbi:MAG: hypothetical protein EOP22_10485 [Hyphomicrobiales bacterium]|nr:MAG: hypothetical protein EOP22_10485 [Hyphomicrobiales bacterium]
MEFTRLETAALAQFTAYYAHEFPALGEHLRHARPVARLNTGNGFYTDLAVALHLPRLECDSPLDNLTCRFDGMKEGLELLLFFRNGAASLLEGYAIAGEDTSSIDLVTSGFSDIVPLWPARKDTNG